MTNHADKAFGEDTPHSCNVTRRDSMLDARLLKTQQDLRRAEDELAAWRGTSTELVALRELRNIIQEEMNDTNSPRTAIDYGRIRRALTYSAPVGIDPVTL